MAAPAFRGLRRDIALVTSDERKRTLYETAKALGRRSGDIQRVVRQMCEEGILKASDPEPTRGTLYWLSEKWTAVLMAEIAAGSVPGMLAEHQRFLLVRAVDSVRFFALIARKDVGGMVAWASELGDEGKWLVALDPSTQITQAQCLIVALKDAGFECSTLRVGSVLDAAQMRQLAAATAAVSGEP